LRDLTHAGALMSFQLVRAFCARRRTIIYILSNQTPFVLLIFVLSHDPNI